MVYVTDTTGKSGLFRGKLAEISKKIEIHYWSQKVKMNNDYHNKIKVYMLHEY